MDVDNPRPMPFQFGLSSMLALVAVIAMALGVWRAFGIIGLTLVVDAIFVGALVAAVLGYWNRFTIVEWLVMTLVVLILNALLLPPIQPNCDPRRKRAKPPTTTIAPQQSPAP